jgi:hypothetical protein
MKETKPKLWKSPEPKSRAADNKALRKRKADQGFVYYRPDVTPDEKQYLVDKLAEFRETKLTGE